MNQLINNPLDQFSIELLGNFQTNIVIYLQLSWFVIVKTDYLLSGSKNFLLLFNKWTVFHNSIFTTILGMVRSQINNNKGQLYLPSIYGLFIFILVNNLIGMIPYSFSTTSHFALTFSLSFSIVLGATILGLINYRLKFFSILVPAGCPLILVPLLVIIEFISYLARNVSLGLRLGANVLSGHMLLNILSGFIYNIMNTGLLFFIISLLPLTFVVLFSGLELAIAFIQAQVFAVLSCSYIKDGLCLD